MAVLAQFEINDQSDQSAKYYREGRRSSQGVHTLLASCSWFTRAVAVLTTEFDVGEKYPCVEQINMSLDHGH